MKNTVSLVEAGAFLVLAGLSFLCLVDMVLLYKNRIKVVFGLPRFFAMTYPFDEEVLFAIDELVANKLINISNVVVWGLNGVGLGWQEGPTQVVTTKVVGCLCLLGLRQEEWTMMHQYWLHMEVLKAVHLEPVKVAWQHCLLLGLVDWLELGCGLHHHSCRVEDGCHR